METLKAKIIVCGGRHFNNYDYLKKLLFRKERQFLVVENISRCFMTEETSKILIDHTHIARGKNPAGDFSF